MFLINFPNRMHTRTPCSYQYDFLSYPFSPINTLKTLMASRSRARDENSPLTIRRPIPTHNVVKTLKTHHRPMRFTVHQRPGALTAIASTPVGRCPRSQSQTGISDLPSVLDGSPRDSNVFATNHPSRRTDASAQSTV